jgi:phosphoribosylaminoimidazole carboxylase
MDTKIGILGGGQLAMMMTEAAFKLGITDITVLDPTPRCPATYAGAKQIIGSFTNAEEILELAKQVDVLTFDIESVNEVALIDARKFACVYPDPHCLEIIKDKYKQNCYLSDDIEIPIPSFYTVEEFIEKGGDDTKIVVKARKGGYDGKGVWCIRADELNDFIEKHNMENDDIFIEEYVDLEKELAVIGYLGRYNQVYLYKIVETVQEDGICTSTICPTSLERHIRKEIYDIARKIIRSFNTKGIFAIELFLTKDNKILVNEISPRVHNSGHYTIEACNCSQFEQHIRSIVGLPNIEPYYLYNEYIVMNNILGTGQAIDIVKIMSSGGVHWYHKKPKEGKIFKKNRKIGHYTTYVSSCNYKHPVVYIIMGSSSDLSTLQPAIDLLKKYNISIKVDVVSAHRSPEWMFEFGKNVESWGARAIIAGAGGAAHLPGMMASLTNVPVIGVPIPTKNHGGMDSLLSIVEMPDGVPVATVGVGKAKNAAILALKIIGAYNSVNDITRANQEKVKNQRANLAKDF